MLRYETSLQLTKSALANEVESITLQMREQMEANFSQYQREITALDAENRLLRLLQHVREEAQQKRDAASSSSLPAELKRSQRSKEKEKDMVQKSGTMSRVQSRLRRSVSEGQRVAVSASSDLTKREHDGEAVVEANRNDADDDDWSVQESTESSIRNWELLKSPDSHHRLESRSGSGQMLVPIESPTRHGPRISSSSKTTPGRSQMPCPPSGLSDKQETPWSLHQRRARIDDDENAAHDDPFMVELLLPG